MCAICTLPFSQVLVCIKVASVYTEVNSCPLDCLFKLSRPKLPVRYSWSWHRFTSLLYRLMYFISLFDSLRNRFRLFTREIADLGNYGLVGQEDLFLAFCRYLWYGDYSTRLGAGRCTRRRAVSHFPERG